ncbi:MAG: hypothetical protein WCD89_20965 [Anaerocolumna sp.]
MAMERINNQDNRKSVYYQSAASDEKTQGKQDGVENNKKDKGTDTIYGGNLKLGQNDIFAKKEQMKKKAMKVLMDAFSGEQKIDENLDERRSNIEKLKKEADRSSGELNRISDLKQELKETCGINDDSIEQKDLELLEKKQDYDNGFSITPLTKEEEERVKNMGSLTEYQQAALEYHNMESTWRKRLNDTNNTITIENRNIEAIQLDRLKTHNIVDASKDSQKIMDTASKEFIGGLLEEAKDNVDDKIEDDVDKDEKIKDKQEKEQEEASKAANKEEAEKKAREDKDSAPMEQMQKEDADWDKAQREIKAMADKEILLSEDIKGLTVDEQV